MNYQTIIKRNRLTRAFLVLGKAVNILFTLLIVISCEDFIRVDPPPTQVVAASVFTDDASANSAISGLYSRIMGTQNFMNIQTTSNAGLSSDEFISPSADPFYTNALVPANTTVLSTWREAYQVLYGCNAILEGLNGSTGVSAATKERLEGEARFMRAYINFYLVNFFGPIPLVTVTAYDKNESIARASVDEVYTAILADLSRAEVLLPAAYVGNEKVRPNKTAAQAMLARVYLYRSESTKAEEYASMVISNTQYALVANLDNVFLKNSTEAIFQLMPVAASYNTYEGNTYVLTAAPTSVSLSTLLVNTFTATDKRKTSWIRSFVSGTATWYYPFKYKVRQGATTVTEYYMVLRLAEQYLIRSEARAQQGNLTGALTDLNVIRQRAGVVPVVTADKTTLLNAIARERQLELMAEWGHRWFDLKRTGQADVILSPLKAPNWQSTDILYPIPQSELLYNPMLAPQNAGY